MEIEIRKTASEDRSETENVIREAFWNCYSPGCCEHYLLHRMRWDKDFVKELDTVAVFGGKIIGNIAYMKSTIFKEDGTECEVLTLGPVGVLPEYQGRGIGRRLIEYTLKLAREMGYSAVLLCGDPDFYSKIGFVPAEKYGIRAADGMYHAALQAFKLYDGALPDAEWVYFENKVYEVDLKAAEDFDKAFPSREKISGILMQKRFVELSRMRTGMRTCRMNR